jgi:hypothetical protein
MFMFVIVILSLFYELCFLIKFILLVHFFFNLCSATACYSMNLFFHFKSSIIIFLMENI